MKIRMSQLQNRMYSSTISTHSHAALRSEVVWCVVGAGSVGLGMRAKNQFIPTKPPASGRP